MKLQKNNNLGSGVDGIKWMFTSSWYDLLSSPGSGWNLSSSCLLRLFFSLTCRYNFIGTTWFKQNRIWNNIIDHVQPIRNEFLYQNETLCHSSKKKKKKKWENHFSSLAASSWIAEEPEGEIGRQHIEGASGCRLSPYMISPHPPRPMTALITYRPWHRELHTLLFSNTLLLLIHVHVPTVLSVCDILGQCWPLKQG